MANSSQQQQVTCSQYGQSWVVAGSYSRTLSSTSRTVTALIALHFRQNSTGTVHLCVFVLYCTSHCSILLVAATGTRCCDDGRQLDFKGHSLLPALPPLNELLRPGFPEWEMNDACHIMDPYQEHYYTPGNYRESESVRHSAGTCAVNIRASPERRLELARRGVKELLQLHARLCPLVLICLRGEGGTIGKAANP